MSDDHTHDDHTHGGHTHGGHSHDGHSHGDHTHGQGEANASDEAAPNAPKPKRKAAKAHDHTHDDHTHDHAHGKASFGTYAGPGETVIETLTNGINNLFKKDARDRKAHSVNLNEALEAIEKKLEAEAKVGEKADRAIANDAKNLFEGIEHYLKDLLEHQHSREHPEDTRKKVEELQGALNTVLNDLKGQDAATVIKELQSTLRIKHIAVPGQLVHPEDMSRIEELGHQVKEHLGQKGIMGKGVAFIGGTVGLGVAVHGLSNIKRGLFGYHDAETGEKRGGAISNVVVGAAEAFVGLSTLKRSLTGGWSLGRAKHGKPHDHDHGHGHDHGHDHGHGHSH